MATRRHESAAARAGRGDGVDALDRRIDWTDVSARATAGLTRWVLGTGLLSLHASAFVVVGLGMLLWNILTDPADLAVTEPLLRWGIVLTLHAAAVLIGRTIWRVLHPPAPLAAYRPTPRGALIAGRAMPVTAATVTATPVWRPDGSMNGHSNGMASDSANGSPPGGANAHVPHPAGVWPPPESPRTVVTSRRVTTMVVATARDGFASARRRYRRDQRIPQPQGASMPQASVTPVPQAWAQPAAAPDQTPSELPAPAADPVPAAGEQPGAGWSATTARDEVISVTQVGPESVSSVDDRVADDSGTDPVRSWLDGYLDDQGREREARWTWVEAAASTWLARGEDDQPALPAPAEPPATEVDRPIDVTPNGPAATDAEIPTDADAVPLVADRVIQPPATADGPSAGSP